MKKNVLTRLVCAAFVLSALSACSSIKELFPDKEKDYQFTTEIPKLIIPSDLAKGDSSSPSASTASPQNTKTTTATEPEAESKPVATEEAETKTASSEKSSSENATADTTDDEKPAIDPKSITVELLESSNKISYLRINTPFLPAWRIVSKGLSRQSIEVSERNQTDKMFTVQYDPDEKTIEDGSYMDEINFMLNGFQSNEKAYLLKLVETNQQTDVVVLNEEQTPVSDEGSLKLLRVLQKSIKTNLAGK